MIDCVGLGEFFRTVRKQRMLTIEDAAAILYLSPKALGNIERGRSEPKFNTALLLCDVYAVDLHMVSHFYTRSAETSYAMELMHYQPM